MPELEQLPAAQPLHCPDDAAVIDRLKSPRHGILGIQAPRRTSFLHIKQRSKSFTSAAALSIIGIIEFLIGPIPWRPAVRFSHIVQHVSDRRYGAQTGNNDLFISFTRSSLQSAVILITSPVIIGSVLAKMPRARDLFRRPDPAQRNTGHERIVLRNILSLSE